MRIKRVRHEAGETAGIDRERIIATLRAHQPELHRRGVRYAALFGFIARGDGKRTSDIDILIELDPQAPVRPLRIRCDYAIPRGPVHGPRRRRQLQRLEAA
jgi:nucleotidyltransferase-like protein